MNKTDLLKHTKTWDRTGVIVATLCIVHCLALPVVVALLPTSRALFESTLLEGFILTLGVAIGSYSFVTSYKQHRMAYPMMLGLMGVALLFIHLLFVPIGDHEESTWTTDQGLGALMDSLHIEPLMIIGGLMLVGGHLWNIHACHCHCDRKDLPNEQHQRA